MLKVAHKTKVVVQPDQETMTATTSLQTVRTLFSAGLGCITWIRGLLSDDNFTDSYLTSSPRSGLLEISESQRTSNSTRIKTVKRGFSTEADCLLDYLENGIFDALEKQYLKSFVFAIYIASPFHSVSFLSKPLSRTRKTQISKQAIRTCDEDLIRSHSLIEAYTFNVSYHEIGANVRVPALSLESSMSNLVLSQDDPATVAAKNGRPPTLGDVKKSVQALVKSLITAIQSMSPIPNPRFATFKICYHDHTPQEYEPPHFVAGDPEKDRFIFSTHNVREAPDRFLFNEINTGSHAVQVQATTISAHLPSHEDDTATFTGHTNVNNTAQTFELSEAKRTADINALLADAENRQVVWDADPADEDAPGEVDPDYKGPSQVPLGVRRGDDIVPIPWKKKEKVVRHRAGQHHVPGLHNAGASSAARAEEATQLLETQATVLIPESAPDPTQPRQDASEVAMDVDRGAGNPEPSQTPDAQQDVVMGETRADGSSTLGRSSKSPARTPATQDESMEATRIHPAIDPAILRWKQVDCDCNIEDETCETFICQGPCGRRLHTWCAGFNTAEEAAHSEYSTCVTCTLRADPVYDLMPDNNRQRLWAALTVLAIFRRTLKLVYERGCPGNPHALQKLVGCTRPDGLKNIKRLEDEGFIESRIVEFDSLGLLGSSVPAKNAKSTKKKTGKKGAVKPRLELVKTPAAMRKLKRYFEPQGEMVQELVKSYRPLKDKTVPPAGGAPAGNVLVPSSSVNIPSQDPVTPTRPSAPPPHEESQTQQETQPFIEAVTPTLRTLSKRRTSTRISENRSKKMKISLAKDVVDLETW
ncbi:DNA binding protein [Ceratobasidium sp. 394]|nr:DNA binding protein [Ceratobasidium sp. 394]